MDAKRAMSILNKLGDLYPGAKAELHFSNPYETLIATILSAQCTDKRVNIVTARLFRDYPDARAMITLTPEQLEPMIKECGIYKNKARSIIGASKALVELYGGEVPRNREQLMALPGVGQKTAGVVLMAAFGDDQIPVDTHVFRVSNRIGLAHSDKPSEVETQLQALIPKREWSHSHHLLIWHGRRCCKAINPDCKNCPLHDGLCGAGYDINPEDEE